jgi:hypothetical protein
MSHFLWRSKNARGKGPNNSDPREIEPFTERRYELIHGFWKCQSQPPPPPKRVTSYTKGGRQVIKNYLKCSCFYTQVWQVSKI